jgi:ATP-dependent Zn protease
MGSGHVQGTFVDVQVLLLAATNRPEILDSALLRPGRISRRIQVPLPDEEGRRDILRVHMRRVPMQDDEYKELCCQHLAAESHGFSGAELFNVVNEAALLAARREGDYVMLRDFLMGIQRTRDGVNARSRRLDNAAKRLSKLLFDRNIKPARATALS